MTSEESNVKLLICSANLGNAQPDTTSVNAWIPLNGQCQHAFSRPPRFPVVMDPRRARNPESHVPAEQSKPSKPVVQQKRHSSFEMQPVEWTRNPSPTRPTEKKKPSKSKRHSSFEMQPVEWTRNPSPTRPTEKKKPSKSKSQERRHTTIGASDPSEWTADFDIALNDSKPEKEEEKPKEKRPSKSKKKSKRRSSREINPFESMADYGQWLKESKEQEEADDDGSEEEYEAFVKALDNKRLPDSGDGSKSAGSLSRNSSLDDAGFDEILTSKSQESFGEDSKRSSKSMSRKSTGSIEFATNFGDLPAPPLRPEQNQGSRQPIAESLEKFDLIVIGMQEATFETEKSKEKEEKTSVEDDADDLSLSASEEDGESDDIGIEVSSDDFDFDDIEPTYNSEEPESGKKSKSTAKKVLGATIKAGKVGLKAGKVGLKAGKAGIKASKKVGIATVKTAKTVNTLASARDHTKRPLPTPQQASLPTEDGKFPGWSDTDVLHYKFEESLSDYIRALSYQLGEMRLVIYYNPGAIKLDVLSVKYKATGKTGLANKGGIVAEVVINNHTRVSFLTAHLEAHEGESKYKTRCSSFLDILSGTKSPTTPFKYDAALASHYMFAMGDLNFRTRLEGIEIGSEKHIKMCHKMTANKDWKTLNKYDELAMALRKRDCLFGFRTPYCNFDPTFKVARGQGYEYNEKRSPSYTDRILFKSADQLETYLRPTLYEPVEDYVTSDHKPIRGAFTLKLNDRVRWKTAKPLNRKAMKKSQVPGMAEQDTARLREHINQEKMHIFVSSLQCIIHPSGYDKLRKTSLADMPNTSLSFLSTPQEAVQLDESKKSVWKKLGFKSSKKKSDSQKSSSTTSRTLGSKKWPSTSIIEDTMRPSWVDENLYFTVRTHLSDGTPIDLSGAMLHITLFDGKGADPKPLGSFSLNLAQLIKVSKNPKSVVSKGPPPRTMSVPTKGMGGRGRGAPPPRQASLSRKDNPAVPMRSKSGDNLDGFRSRSPMKSRSKDSLMDMRATVTSDSRGIKNGGPLSPSGRQHRPDGGRGVMNSPAGRGTVRPRSSMSPGQGRGMRLPGGKPSRGNSAPGMSAGRGSLKNISLGASRSLKLYMHQVEDEFDPDKMEERLQSMQILSIRLDEPLTESGLEVARMKCSLDVWWTEEDHSELFEGNDDA